MGQMGEGLHHYQSAWPARPCNLINVDVIWGKVGENISLVGKRGNIASIVYYATVWERWGTARSGIGRALSYNVLSGRTADNNTRRAVVGLLSDTVNGLLYAEIKSIFYKPPNS